MNTYIHTCCGTMSGSSSTNMWGWLEQASSQAKDLMSQAQEGINELSKQAVEIQKNYEAERQASIRKATESNTSLKPAQSAPREPVKLEDLDFTYVTENVVGMGFPFDPAKRKNNRGNRVDDVADYLRRSHGGHFMIWNISEDTYDYSMFADQVLEYKFPGHPAPPLGLMFKMCTSMESWLDADSRNIAVVHCLTGKGRTAVVLACVLTWIGEFSSPMESLSYVADRKGLTVDTLTIPSQRRYIQYFSNVLDGVRPRAEPLLLRRVIMNGVPRYGGEGDAAGCCPYLQLFKNGRIIANAVIAAPASSESTKSQDVRWLNCTEGSVSFQVDCMVQGDLLLRCRHLEVASGARVSMFRTAFHTGYVPSGVLRLTKAQLDGPNTDDRYGDDFFIDLIFAPVERSSEASKSGESGKTSDSGISLDPAFSDKFEQMLHRDTRFWESVSARKARAKRRKSRKFVSESAEKFSIFDDIPNRSTQLREEDEDEVVFSAQLSSSAAGAGGISDDDLIKQLAEAENDDVVMVGSQGQGGSDTDSFVKADPNSSPSSTGKSHTLSTGSVSSSQTASQQSKEGGSSASLELKALEDLEKELGLDLSTCETINDTDSAVKPSGDRPVASPSLDDLEDFLESLNTSGGTS
mmetsp:Transcript_12095/g.18274  ORF Transcript_12095/g.18274 Transcript_12095/m.18274 type:complete len:636 (-) Transcript_12095:141-2048(-)